MEKTRLGEGNYASSVKSNQGRITCHDLGLTLLPGSQIQLKDHEVFDNIEAPEPEHGRQGEIGAQLRRSQRNKTKRFDAPRIGLPVGCPRQSKQRCTEKQRSLSNDQCTASDPTPSRRSDEPHQVGSKDHNVNQDTSHIKSPLASTKSQVKLPNANSRSRKSFADFLGREYVSTKDALSTSSTSLQESGGDRGTEVHEATDQPRRKRRKIVSATTQPSIYSRQSEGTNAPEHGERNSSGKGGDSRSQRPMLRSAISGTLGEVTRASSTVVPTHRPFQQPKISKNLSPCSLNSSGSPISSQQGTSAAITSRTLTSCTTGLPQGVETESKSYEASVSYLASAYKSRASTRIAKRIGINARRSASPLYPRSRFAIDKPALLTSTWLCDGKSRDKVRLHEHYNPSLGATPTEDEEIACQELFASKLCVNNAATDHLSKSKTLLRAKCAEPTLPLFHLHNTTKTLNVDDDYSFKSLRNRSRSLDDFASQSLKIKASIKLYIKSSYASTSEALSAPAFITSNNFSNHHTPLRSISIPPTRPSYSPVSMDHKNFALSNQASWSAGQAFPNMIAPHQASLQSIDPPAFQTSSTEMMDLYNTNSASADNHIHSEAVQILPSSSKSGYPPKPSISPVAFHMGTQAGMDYSDTSFDGIPSGPWGDLPAGMHQAHVSPSQWDSLAASEAHNLTYSVPPPTSHFGTTIPQGNTSAISYNNQQALNSHGQFSDEMDNYGTTIPCDNTSTISYNNQQAVNNHYARVFGMDNYGTTIPRDNTSALSHNKQQAVNSHHAQVSGTDNYGTTIMPWGNISALSHNNQQAHNHHAQVSGTDNYGTTIPWGNTSALSHTNQRAHNHHAQVSGMNNYGRTAQWAPSGYNNPDRMPLTPRTTPPKGDFMSQIHLICQQLQATNKKLEANKMAQYQENTHLRVDNVRLIEEIQRLEFERSLSCGSDGHSHDSGPQTSLKYRALYEGEKKRLEDAVEKRNKELSCARSKITYRDAQLKAKDKELERKSKECEHWKRKFKAHVEQMEKLQIPQYRSRSEICNSLGLRELADATPSFVPSVRHQGEMLQAPSSEPSGNIVSSASGYALAQYEQQADTNGEASTTLAATKQGQTQFATSGASRGSVPIIDLTLETSQATDVVSMSRNASTGSHAASESSGSSGLSELHASIKRKSLDWLEGYHPLREEQPPPLARPHKRPRLSAGDAPPLDCTAPLPGAKPNTANSKKAVPKASMAKEQKTQARQAKILANKEARLTRQRAAKKEKIAGKAAEKQAEKQPLPAEDTTRPDGEATAPDGLFEEDPFGDAFAAEYEAALDAIQEEKAANDADAATLRAIARAQGYRSEEESGDESEVDIDEHDAVTQGQASQGDSHGATGTTAETNQLDIGGESQVVQGGFASDSSEESEEE
ncbi:hypothetical protein MMC24_003386 [Lignoscripta atroalba]|nr:hypothetical protein [Lignoscripta atroalba]